MPDDPYLPPLGWSVGGDEIARLVDATDWASTPLGPRARWSPALELAVEIILASAFPMALRWGPEFILIYNDAYRPILGDKHPWAMGRRVQDVYAELWTEIAKPHIDLVFHNAPAVFAEDLPLRIQRHGDEWEQVRFSVSYSPVKDPTAPTGVGGVLITLVETTQRVLAGERLTAERDQLWTLSQDMLARADYSGGMSAVNPAWTHVLGWSEQELLTNPYADIINADDLPHTVAALERMRQTGRPTRFENRILSKAGQWITIGWTLSPEDDGVNFIATGRDLTEDKALQDQLLQAQDALRQAQKMEAVGQLTGGIAHDFNNLLAAISGSLELVDKRLAENRAEGVERYVGIAQQAARRAAALTQRLLAFSRRQTLDPRPTDINQLVAGMDDLIRRTVGPGIEVEVAAASDLWLTRIDAAQLENGLLNLVLNARDAMPDGGRITVETANHRLDAQAAAARDLAPGSYISLCVTDTGTGMTPDVVTRAFDPFYTTKPLGQGTGLGLSMVHGFARQSGGQVHITSQVGKGTTLCLYMPRFAGTLEAPEPAIEPADEGLGAGETILIIDDELAILTLMTEVLEEAGYRVLQAGDGPEGMNILQSDARIDLLITDVGLPGGMNGRQVADAARVGRPDLKVLFVTGYAETTVIGDGLLEPGMQVITKPFPVTGLAGRVRAIIER